MNKKDNVHISMDHRTSTKMKKIDPLETNNDEDTNVNMLEDLLNLNKDSLKQREVEKLKKKQEVKRIKL